MARSFLLRAANIAAIDTALVAAGYATQEARDEEQVSLDIPISGTINGQPFVVYEQFNFRASVVEAFTLPRTISRSVPYDFGGISGNVNVDFTVTAIQTYQQQRESWLAFQVNGDWYRARRNGGAKLLPVAGVKIYDFDAQGWPLVNKKATLDTNGDVITPAEIIPGVFVGLRFVDQALIDSDTRTSPSDDTLFERSALANGFKTNGTERTYTRTPAQTDWGVRYTVTYYERQVGGATIGLVDPATLPEEIVRQHGAIKRAVQEQS